MKKIIILFAVVFSILMVSNPCSAQRTKTTIKTRTTQVKKPVQKMMSIFNHAVTTYTFNTVHPYAMMNGVDFDDNVQNGKYSITINLNTHIITFCYQTKGKAKKEVSLKSDIYYMDEQTSSFYFSRDEESSSKLVINFEPKTRKETISLDLVYDGDPELDKKVTSYFGRNELCNDGEYFRGITFTNLSNVDAH